MHLAGQHCLRRCNGPITLGRCRTLAGLEDLSRAAGSDDERQASACIFGAAAIKETLCPPWSKQGSFTESIMSGDAGSARIDPQMSAKVKIPSRGLPEYVWNV